MMADKAKRMAEIDSILAGDVDAPSPWAHGGLDGDLAVWTPATAAWWVASVEKPELTSACIGAWPPVPGSSTAAALATELARWAPPAVLALPLADPAARWAAAAEAAVAAGEGVEDMRLAGAPSPAYAPGLASVLLRFLAALEADGLLLAPAAQVEAEQGTGALLERVVADLRARRADGRLTMARAAAAELALVAAGRRSG